MFGSITLEMRERIFYVVVVFVFIISAFGGRDLEDPAVWTEVVLPIIVILVVAIVGYFGYKRGYLGELRF